LGFLDDAGGIVREISWIETDLVIGANTTRWVTINENGVVQFEAALPTNLETRIILGRVISGDTDIGTIEDVPLSMIHSGNAIERFLRGVFGAQFESGSQVMEGSTDRTLDITAGTYFVGTSMISPVGGTPVTFSEIIRDGAGGFTLGAADITVVTNSEYDDDSGSKVAIPAGEYAKHTVLINQSEGSDVYRLILSQAAYSTLNDAQNATLPIFPVEVGVNTFVQIAEVIVQQGQTNLQDISDIRPRPSFAQSAGSAVSNHGGLSGLPDDDHPQYLLGSGSRAMTGNLDMSTNNVINVGTVDGVNVSAHAARHLPNGLDALTTGPASEITDSANSTGIANAMARQDHGHAHGNRGGGALHAAVIAAGANGFMTGADKSKLNGLPSLVRASSRMILDSTSATGTGPADVSGSSIVWDVSRYSNYAAGVLVFYAEIGNRDLTVEVFDVVAAAVIGTLTVTTVQGTGIYALTITNPASDTYLILRLNKSSGGGTNPTVHAANMEFDLS
jgi:hypothetical protein